MPTAGRPRSSALDHVTRQQLDELDALMQRMLALPVNPPEDSPAGPGQPQTVSTPANAQESQALPPGSPSEPVPPLPFQQREAEALVGKSDLPDTGQASNAPVTTYAGASGLYRIHREYQPEARAKVDSVTADLSETTIRPQHGSFKAPHSLINTPPSPITPSPRHPVTPSAAQAVATAAAITPRVAWPLRPLLWLNDAFDYGTAWLGPVGSWLRAPGGRTLLGWTGLLLLAAAFVWLVLDGMGWTW